MDTIKRCCIFVLELKPIDMKTVIYKERTFKIVRVVDCEISITDLSDDEDFMPVDIWNQSDDKENFPTIN